MDAAAPPRDSVAASRAHAATTRFHFTASSAHLIHPGGAMDISGIPFHSMSMSMGLGRGRPGRPGAAATHATLAPTSTSISHEMPAAGAGVCVCVCLQRQRADVRETGEDQSEWKEETCTRPVNLEMHANGKRKRPVQFTDRLATYY